MGELQLKMKELGGANPTTVKSDLWEPFYNRCFEFYSLKELPFAHWDVGLGW